MVEAIEFAPRLRALRKRAGLTQTQLAEKAHMHRQGIVKLERGEREPAWSTLLALANALSIQLQEFVEVEPDVTEVVTRGRPRKVPTVGHDEDQRKGGQPHGTATKKQTTRRKGQ